MTSFFFFKGSTIQYNDLEINIVYNEIKNQETDSQIIMQKKRNTAQQSNQRTILYQFIFKNEYLRFYSFRLAAIALNG